MGSKAEIPPWGFDLTGMDKRVDPGSSLYAYANGGWLAGHEIPRDRAYWGTFALLRERTEQRILELIADSSDHEADGGSAVQVRDFYDAFCAVDAIEAAGLEPLRHGLLRIEAARGHEDIAALLCDASLGALSPLRLQIVLDDKDPDRYCVLLGQSGLGLPDRETYLSSATVPARLRAAYAEHITRLLERVGARDAAANARAILRLETRIAELHWPAAQRRERALTYNPRSRAALEASVSSFPWQAFLRGAGLSGQGSFVLAELDAVLALACLFREVPVAVWAQYLAYHHVVAHAEVLPRAIEDECFAFYGRTLSGQAEPRPRASRAVHALNLALGDAVGKLYVGRYFREPHRSQLLSLVERLRATFASRLRKLPWMSEATRQAAQRKLATFIPKIGFPDAWQDYSTLEVRRADAFGNALRARVWSWQRDLRRLQQPADRRTWFRTAQTVNASYNPAWNEIVFPAGLLQPPFFDPQADLAVNYGAIGAVIGHEMGHGFDDQGAKSDERGVLGAWWLPADERAFRSLVERLVAQYDAYEPLPGVHVNGQLTLGENIADLGGLSLAYAAYRAALGGRTPPLLDGFSGDQRFFLGWAQIWRQLRRDESLRQLLQTDPHSPSALRVDGVVRNMDAFYAAFNVGSEAALWLPPEQRVRIW